MTHGHAVIFEKSVMISRYSVRGVLNGSAEDQVAVTRRKDCDRFFASRNPKQTHTRLINHINAATETRFHRKNCARRCRVGCVLGDNKEGSSSTTSPSRQAGGQTVSWTWDFRLWKRNNRAEENQIVSRAAA